MLIQDSPAYWKKACAQLSKADPIMAGIIKLHRASVLQSRGDAFTTLARAIVGQQISVKAAASVWERLSRTVHPWSAESLRMHGALGLSGLGLSGRKIEYLLDLSAHFCNEPNLALKLAALDDASVIDRLTLIRGVGPWTAEMFLIFGLRRPDILPVKDLGLMKAISLHYRKGKAIDIAAARRIAIRWVPWRSVATWYLWRSLDPISVDY